MDAVGEPALVVGQVTADGRVSMPGVDLPLEAAVTAFTGGHR